MNFTSSQYGILAMLASAAAAGTLSYLAADADGHALVNAGAIEVNGTVTDPNDASKYAARITQAGTDALNAYNASQNGGDVAQTGFAGQSGFGAQTGAVSGTVSSAPQTSTTATAVKAPKSTPVRGVLSAASVNKVAATRSRAKEYDFGALKSPSEMGNGNLDAFFVADVEGQKPKTETLKSAVSAAKREFATVTGTKPGIKPGTTQNVYDYVRVFEIFGNPGPNGEKGAWVARTK